MAIEYNTLMQPGSVINPGTSEQAPTETSQPQNVPTSPAATPTETFNASGFDEPDYNEPQQQQTAESYQLPPEEVSWSASEYISHSKDMSWYVSLGVGAGLFAALVYFVTQDIISFATVLIVALLFGVFGSRKPDVLQYSVQSEGIMVANKLYSFSDFRSFSVHEDGPLPSASFMPTKRFMPGLTILLPPDQAREIVDTLSQYLPIEERRQEAVDRLMKRLRF